MKKAKNKIIKFLYNPWVVGIAFYLLGLLTPNTIATIKKTTHINVAGNYYEGITNNSNEFYFWSFFLILLFLLIILVINILDKNE